MLCGQIPARFRPITPYSMGDMDQLTYEQFINYLRSALHYLFDPVHLRRSPLIALLGLGNEFDQAAALQQLLIRAIRSLKPDDDEPPQSRAWRIYDTLNLQYVRQLERDAVATQLGISERQMRREQRVAIEALAQQLWHTLSLAGATAADALHSTEPAASSSQTLTQELSWLKTPTTEARLPLREALDDVLLLAQPLARQWDVTLNVELPEALARLPVSQLALRTILPTLLTMAIPRAGRAPVVVSARQRQDPPSLCIECTASYTDQAPLSTKEQDTIGTMQEVAFFYGASIAFAASNQRAFAISLILPMPAQLSVLVIDDNADWLELVERYASGSRYRIVGIREPAAAPGLVEKLQPALILLDVMMQNVDGWQVLTELLQKPGTSHIPIILCTILPLEEMAISLGATAFLQKPVSQQQFLELLDKQSSLSG